MSIEWSDLGTAFGLMLVLEGLLPFVSPDRLKRLYLKVGILESRSVRVMGLSSMVLGLLLLSLAR